MDAPRSPVPPLAICLAAAAASAAVGVAAGLSGTTLLEAPLSLLLLGVVLTLARGISASRTRAEADDWIRRGYAGRYAWRADELTSRRERRRTARVVNGLLRELEPGAPLGPVPLDRRALRANRRPLEALARRLSSEKPVSAAGMVEVEHLLTDPESPVFPRIESTPDRADLGSSIVAATEALEVHR